MTYCVAIKRNAGLDRVITPDTLLDEATKCALVSMDATRKSNLSVGLSPKKISTPQEKLL